MAACGVCSIGALFLSVCFVEDTGLPMITFIIQLIVCFVKLFYTCDHLIPRSAF